MVTDTVTLIPTLYALKRWRRVTEVATDALSQQGMMQGRSFQMRLTLLSVSTKVVGITGCIFYYVYLPINLATLAAFT